LVLGEALKGLFRWGLKALLCLIAAQAALVAGLEAAGRVRRGLRRRLRGGPSEGGREGFAWQQREEIELESGGARLKLYTQGEELYEEMLEEIGRAERNVFLGTFIWKDDEWGRRFVEALAENEASGSLLRPLVAVRVYQAAWRQSINRLQKPTLLRFG